MPDVVIVGGGPAGLYAGARVASAGFRTLLLEEHPAVGAPVHCTGVLAAQAFDEFALSRASLLNELRTVRFYSPAGREITYSQRRVEAVVIDRLVFDRELSESAERSGVAIRRGVRALGVQIDRGGVTVKTSDDEMRAQVCILACGANYSLHRQVKLGMPRLFLHTAQLEVAATRPRDVELHFGTEVAPKGFGWVVPVNRPTGSCARIGVMCAHGAPKYFERLVERVASRWGISPDDIERPRLKILPLSAIARTYGNRLLAVGDAAGLVKPTTGGGIYYSLVSASIAAKVLIKAFATGDFCADGLACYETEWRERLAAEFRAQLSLRLFAHQMTDIEIERLFDLAGTDGVMPIVRSTASFNRHRKLILALLKHPPVRQLLLRQLAF